MERQAVSLHLDLAKSLVQPPQPIRLQRLAQLAMHQRYQVAEGALGVPPALVFGDGVGLAL